MHRQSGSSQLFTNVRRIKIIAAQVAARREGRDPPEIPETLETVRVTDLSLMIDRLSGRR